MTEATYWNGEPCQARKVQGIVADASFPAYWARSLIGTRRNAVEITYGDATFYIDDQEHAGEGYDGCGWAKVTTGRGSPRYMHRSITLEAVEARDNDQRDWTEEQIRNAQTYGLCEICHSPLEQGQSGDLLFIRCPNCGPKP